MADTVTCVPSEVRWLGLGCGEGGDSRWSPDLAMLDAGSQHGVTQ